MATSTQKVEWWNGICDQLTRKYRVVAITVSCHRAVRLAVQRPPPRQRPRGAGAVRRPGRPRARPARCTPGHGAGVPAPRGGEADRLARGLGRPDADARQEEEQEHSGPSSKCGDGRDRRRGRRRRWVSSSRYHAARLGHTHGGYGSGLSRT